MPLPLTPTQIIKNILAGDNSKDGSNSILKSINTDKQSFRDADRRDNSIKAVSTLLKSFLDQESVDTIQNIRTSSLMSNSLENTVGFGQPVNSKFLPSYNVRTPIVEITINGYPIYPDKRILGTTQVVPARLNFQSFNLKLPMGGPEKSVTGQLVLFTKNPEEILAYTESWASQEAINRSMSGLPIMTLRFGWAFSDSKHDAGDSPTQVNTASAMSPQLNFVITNIAMVDPGTAGTTFTFTLQELGTVVLQNSSDNLIISSDYPQQQLRIILEGILRVRLFTLDDILYIGNRNKDLLKNELGKKDGTLNTTDLSVLIPKSIINSNIIKDTLFKDTQDYTFFTNTPSADIGINNRNFETVANELAAQCRCKWFPHINGDKDDARLTQNASGTLAKIASDIKMIKALPAGTVLTKEQIDDVLKTLGDDTSKEGQNSGEVSTEHTLRRSSSRIDALNSLEVAARANMARLSARCRLVWVSNVPADWNTTGSKFFTDSKNVNDKTAGQPSPYIEGAYFLLPDILEDFDIFTKDLPIVYGSGASNMPYFYGSGQNVFQASLGAKQPEMFGEVLSLSTNHNNLIVQLAASIKEEMAYAIEGKRMYGIAAAEKWGTAPGKKAAAKVKGNSHIDSDDERKAKAEKVQGWINKTKKEIYDSSINNKWQTGGLASGGSLALGSGNLLVGDHPSLVGHAKSSSLTEAEGPIRTASLRIRSRIANFLRYPTATKITVLGDPNLIRLGPGCFELFSYYPVENENGIVTQELNALTSGVYFVQSIEHNITMGDFTTTLNGTKAVDPMNVPSSITTKIINKLGAEDKDEKARKLANDAISKNNTAKQEIKVSKVSASLAAQFSSVNLNSQEFSSGILADELRKTLSIYKTLPN